LLRLQRQVSGYKLLIIDELGYVPLSQTGAELLFEIFSQRYERGSTIVTSNLPFDEWTSVFGSERLTGALLDRLRRSPRCFRQPSCRPALSTSSAIPWISPHGRTASRSPPISKRSTGRGDADHARKALEDFDASAWGRKYPAIAQSWRRNWEYIIPSFAFPVAVRRIIYTTDEIDKRFCRSPVIFFPARATSWRRVEPRLKALPGRLIRALPA
jgi:hypothetical protein